MSTPILTKVEGQDYTFRDIFSIYDKQFQDLLNFILTQKGDIYTVEEFKDSTDKIIKLSESYQNGTVIVYINDIIQWKNEDYTESSDYTITLINDRNIDDVIKVVVIQSNFLQSNLNSYLQVIKDKVAEVEELKNRAEYLTNLFDEFEYRLQQKIDSYNEEKDKIEKLLALIRDVQMDIDEKIIKIEAVFNNLDSIESNIEEIYKDIKIRHTDITDKYNEILSLAIDIEEIKELLESISDDFNTKYDDFILKYKDFLSKYDDISDMHEFISATYEEIKSLKTDIEQIKSDIDNIHNDIITKAEQVELNTNKTYTYYQDVVDLRDDIIDLSGTLPDDFLDNEVVLARSGAHILGDRLDKFAYYFDSTQKMLECLFLKDSDKCIVCDNEKGTITYYSISDTKINDTDEQLYNNKFATVTSYQYIENFRWKVL